MAEPKFTDTRVYMISLAILLWSIPLILRVLNPFWLQLVLVAKWDAGPAFQALGVDT